MGRSSGPGVHYLSPSTGYRQKMKRLGRRRRWRRDKPARLTTPTNRNWSNSIPRLPSPTLPRTQGQQLSLCKRRIDPLRWTHNMHTPPFTSTAELWLMQMRDGYKQVMKSHRWQNIKQLCFETDDLYTPPARQSGNPLSLRPLPRTAHAVLTVKRTELQ